MGVATVVAMLSIASVAAQTDRPPYAVIPEGDETLVLGLSEEQIEDLLQSYISEEEVQSILERQFGQASKHVWGELRLKPIGDLIFLKASDSPCSHLNCFGLSDEQVRRYIDAAQTALQSEAQSTINVENAKAVKVNYVVAIVSAIVSVISLCVSSGVSLVALRKRA
jgi:hypothetical protein